MESFFSRYKNALVLIIVLMAQIFSLAVQVRRPMSDAPDAPAVRLIRYWVFSLIAPPERALHLGGGGIRGVWSDYLDLVHVRQQNQDLQKELNRLRIEQGSLVEDVRQAQRLQALLDFQHKFIYTTLPAQVIGTSGTDQSRVLVIDKGSSDGVKANMAVITPDGIVGKVREVFSGSSQVVEISDQTSGAGVILANTRIRGILRGNASGQPEIINISPDDRIKPGEPIITTGGDRIFPRGLPVGTVAGVAQDPDSTFVSIVVNPGANLGRLEEVLVITAMTDQMPAQQQQDLADSAAAAANQRAADVLSQRLPSKLDPNAPPPPAADPQHPVAPVDLTGIPVPVHAPAAIHPDKYSPGAVAPATELTPGARVTESAPTAAAPTIHRAAPATDDGASPQPPARRSTAAPASGAAPQPLVHRSATVPIGGALTKPPVVRKATPVPNSGAPSTARPITKPQGSASANSLSGTRSASSASGISRPAARVPPSTAPAPRIAKPQTSGATHSTASDPRVAKPPASGHTTVPPLAKPANKPPVHAQPTPVPPQGAR